MNKLFTKIAKLFLGISMAAGVGVAVAQKSNELLKVDASSPCEITLSTTGCTATGYDSGEERTWSQDGTSFGAVYLMKSGTNMQFQKNNAKVYNTTAMGGSITAITLTVGSGTARNWSLKLGTTRANVAAVSGYSASSTGWSSISGTYTYFEIHSPASGASYLSKISISYSSGYTVTKNATNCTITGDTTVDGSANASYTIAGTGTYVAPESVTVQRGSTTLTPTTHYSYYTTDGTGYLTIYKAQITGNLSITASGRATYSVTGSITNGSLSPTDRVASGDYYEGTITPSSGYSLPDSVSVTRGGVDISSSEDVTYLDGDIVVENVTGDLVITAVCAAQGGLHDISVSVTNGTYSGDSQITGEGEATITITPSSGYKVPLQKADITVSNAVEWSYTRNSNNQGVINIIGATGDVSISASCVELANYTITVTNTNGTYSGDTSITEGSTASVTITPNSGYKLPESVTVTGATQSYNSSTGVISLSAPSANVVISAECLELATYSITVHETNGSHTGATSIQENGVATITFTHVEGCAHPNDVTVTGATKSWNKTSGVLTLSNPTANVEVTYAGIANQLDSISLSSTSGTYILGEPFADNIVVTAHYTVASDAVVTPTSVTTFDPYVTGEQIITYSYTEGNITKQATYTATVNAKSVTTNTTWTRVTSVDDLTAGTYIIGYEATAGSGTIVPLRSDGANATTSANGYFYTGTSAGSSDSNTISIATNMTSTGYEFTVEKISSNVINIKNAAGNYLGATSGGSTSNKGRLYTSGNSNETNFTVNYSSNKFSMTAAVSGSYKYLKYNTGSPRYAVYNSSANDTSFYKKGTESTGTASLIRIVCDPSIDAATGYKGGEKYVGDRITTSDFVVKKQLDTGNALTAVTDFTINGGSEVTLNSTSNSITVSYTEGGVTKTATVVVAATEREAELSSITLNVGENAVLDGYIAWSGATWDLTDITVVYDWTVDDFDDEVSLQDLVETGDATLSPAVPTAGATSFTVSYEYLDVEISDGTVTLDEAVVADYIDDIKWTGKSLANFKAFSGEQLTAATVNSWTVKAVYKGAGDSDALSFGTGSNQFTIKVGSKSVTSLPYTWESEDDEKYIAVVVGGVAKEDHTNAIANICATINAIDHEVEGSGSITIDLSDASKYSKTGTSGTGSETEVSLQGFTFWTDKGYAYNGESMRVYSGAEFKITSENTITSVSYTFTGGKTGLTGASGISTNEYTETAGSQARVVSVTIGFEGSVTTHFANDVNHFEAQKAVVKYAKAFNTAMNASNVCTGTFENLETGWANASAAYTTFLSDIALLETAEQTWAKSMLAYANGGWSTDAEEACVDKAMATYDHVVRTYKLTQFMSEVRTVSPSTKISPLVLFGNNLSSNTIATIVIISMVSVTAIGGYFFLRKRKENN